MSSASTPLHLKPIKIPGLSRRLEVGEGGMSLGRDPANRVVIPGDRFPHVSGHHARFEIEGGQLIVEDQDSKNGTLVNGEPIVRTRLQKPGGQRQRSIVFETRQSLKRRLTDLGCGLL